MSKIMCPQAIETPDMVMPEIIVKPREPEMIVPEIIVPDQRIANVKSTRPVYPDA